jgi:hypothetical protein
VHLENSCHKRRDCELTMLYIELFAWPAACLINFVILKFEVTAYESFIGVLLCLICSQSHLHSSVTFFS